MFRPSGGHHQVFTSFEEKRQAICYIYFGAEVSDRLWRLISIIKPRIVKSITYKYAISENSEPRRGLLACKLKHNSTIMTFGILRKLKTKN
jgi:hypothetical protein